MAFRYRAARESRRVKRRDATSALFGTLGGGTTINCAVGTATAAGITGSIDVGLNCTVGTATASGITAAIQTGSGVTINCVVGTATASGITCRLDEQIGCLVGTATAAGVACLIEQANATARRGGGGAVDRRRTRLDELWERQMLETQRKEAAQRARLEAEQKRAKRARKPAKPAVEAPPPAPVESIADRAAKLVAEAPQREEIRLVPAIPVQAKVVPDVQQASADDEDEMVFVLAQVLLLAA